MSRLLLLFRLSLYAVLPAVIIWLTLVYLDVDGMRVISADVREPSAMISRLFPEQRLAPITAEGQAVLKQPVYFTVRKTRPYESASVRVELDNPDDLEWQIGVEVPGQSDWNYVRQTPDDDNTATLDLRNALVTRGAWRFMLSHEQDKDMQGMSVRRITVTLLGRPLMDLIRTKLLAL